MRLLARGRRLREAGVVGLNRRNADYVALENPRRLYPLVDDKCLTKELAMSAGIPVPELYGVLRAQHEIDDLPVILEGREDFVLKPAHGSGGNGILVVAGRRGERFQTAGGAWIDFDALAHHVSSTLSGLYSLGGHRDAVLIEYRVQFDPLFREISFQGVPDVRIIVYRGHPVMAMVRLPTRRSEGKANLHQGAVGVGIDLATGVTLGGVLDDGPVDHHPDTGHPLAGLAVPHWDGMLALAARARDVTGLGYLGVDLVLDRELGPLLLELNARPGLAVQIANRAGLGGRLEEVARHADPAAGVEERLAFVRSRGWS